VNSVDLEVDILRYYFYYAQHIKNIG